LESPVAAQVAGHLHVRGRHGLDDACVLAVPAEFANTNSGSSDHPQQCDLHRLTTLEEKDFLLIFLIGLKKISP